MASDLHVIVVLCLTSGLWIATATCGEQSGDCGATCPTGWTQFGSRCFLFQLRPMDWADAERFCTSLGGNLASLQTAGEYAFIRQLIYKAANSHKPTWVGGYDAAKDGVWLWSDGSKFVFNGWARGEPNNSAGGEACMEINLFGRDFVNDAKCRLRKSFVCARNP
uniref:C-type lectin 3 n=1 Tax=Oplegnathus fasciatus TaxID=163134 RepID=J7MFZ0_OPLFA|nr:C-type lectin 3 [Oplegnathus fasciatus]